ncbi:MAG: N-acetylmuramoyl-L-alanine amidase [Clostridia bacterium]|nr:N-acetylmuramoyl-L-alanine amidase [Clostridia bacterium]
MSKTKFFLFSFVIFTLIFVLLCSLFFFLSSLNSNEIKKTDGDTAPEASFPTVIIDAGHGGEDGGAVGIDGTAEKDLNLDIARKLYDALTQSGIPCVMTRNEDILLYDRNQDYRGRKKALDMQARLDIARQYDNAIFISIHQNSFPVEKYSGFQAYYSPNNQSSQALASHIESGVRERLQPENKRVAKCSDGKIYLLDKLTCPAVLLECGFLSNADECAKLGTEEYRTQLARSVADSIIEFFNQSTQ